MIFRSFNILVDNFFFFFFYILSINGPVFYRILFSFYIHMHASQIIGFVFVFLGEKLNNGFCHRIL
jgi:hypothetical protein